MKTDDPQPSKGPAPEGDLFRAEAVAEQQDRWLGTVLLVPKISSTLLTAFAVLATAGILGLLFFGEYTRKARIGGWLAPEQGLIQIVAPQAGVLTQVNAHEGWEVTKGTPLAVLSAELRSEALGATQGEVVRHLRNRRDSLLAERDRQRDLHAQQVAALTGRLTAMEAEGRQLDQEFTLLRARLALAERAVARQHQLRARALATEMNLREAEEDALDQALALQTLEREHSTLARERREIEALAAEAPLREATRLAEIDRDIATLEQELAEAEAQRQVVIAAPRDGTVTALQSALGGSVGPDAPLLTMVPAGSKLEARLYGPSRAIGFIGAGQRVLLRYHAFPYQKFGQYQGVVTSVSRSTVSPAELPEQAPGMSDPGAANEPVYRITVELGSQTATAYGESVPLQPGMLLDADVMIETRRLYEWVLDPLYSLTGRGQA